MYCVVKDCKSFWKPNCDIKFHGFPKNEVKRKKWLSIVPIKGKMYQHAKICSLHFKPEDYEPGNKFLLKNVVPFYLPHPCNCCSPVDEACIDCMDLSTSTNIEVETDPLSFDINTIKEETDLEESEKNACSDCMESIKEEDISDPLSDDSCQLYSYTTQKETALEESEKNVVNIDTQDEPPAKRARFQDFSVQVKIKTPREISLEKTKRALKQKINRQREKIKKLRSLVSTVKKKYVKYRN
ncbi:unnamed protein product [Colias eurytheme]|nr:unnamed protein product [Colias eurytheme]